MASLVHKTGGAARAPAYRYRTKICFLDFRSSAARERQYALKRTEYNSSGNKCLIQNILTASTATDKWTFEAQPVNNLELMDTMQSVKQAMIRNCYKMQVANGFEAERDCRRRSV